MKQRNDWISRSSEPDIAVFTGKELNQGEIPGMHIPLGAMLIQQSGFLMIHEFLNCYHQNLENNNRIYHSDFDFQLLHFTNEKITWKNFSANQIIFCEGAQGRFNPYFKWLPFIPSKGEILKIHAPGLCEKFVQNKGLYILPVGGEYFKVGATNEWNDLNDIPTYQAKIKMMRILSEIISVPYKITEHHAALRPTVKDRRPFVGKHPEYKTLNIFNGLGTKGVILAPYFANQLCEFLVHRKEIDPEVNINRFSGSIF